jgi:cyanophycin synthetase
VTAKVRRAVRQAWRVLDVAGRRQEAAVRALRARFFERMWRDSAAAIGADIEDVGYGFFRIARAGRVTFVRQSDVMLDDHLSLEIAGNKPLVYKLLARDGYPTPGFLEFDLATLHRAERFLDRLGGPAVVKPASGTGGGAGVTTNVVTRRALRRAARLADAFDPSLLVEQQVAGDSYRLLYLDGRCIDAIRRDPPAVTGDGRRTIRALVEAENHRRLTADPPSALSVIRMDQDCRAKLRLQGLRPTSVPGSGQVVPVKHVVNQNAAREHHAVGDRVHPAVVETGRRAVAALGLRLAGVDVLTPDITAPLADTAGVINEINTTPGLHHHVLVAGRDERPPVPALILERILSPQPDVPSGHPGTAGQR